MKHGWEIKKLGEVCEVIGGSTPKTNEASYWDGEHFWITPAELDGRKYFSSTSRTLTDEGVKSAHLQLLPKGTVLLSSRAPIGKVAITCVPMYCNQGFKNIVCSDALYNEYVYWYLLYNKDYLNSLGTGATFKEISKKVVSEIPIPVPPLPIQERIVSELDCINGILEKKREQIKELDALAQSIFYDMFGDPIQNEKGWEVKKLGEISIVKIGPFGSLLHTSDYISGGTPLVNPVHMQDEKICPDIDFTVSKEKLSELQNYLLQEGDIVFARRGDIGRCALVRDTENGFLCGTGSLYVRIIEDVDRIFFIKVMRSSSMIKLLNSFAKGATMLNINCKIIENLPIPLPPLSLQQAFAEKIEAIEKQKELVKRSIAETKTLLASRMQHYFSEE